MSKTKLFLDLPEISFEIGVPVIPQRYSATILFAISLTIIPVSTVCTSSKHRRHHFTVVMGLPLCAYLGVLRRFLSYKGHEKNLSKINIDNFCTKKIGVVHKKILCILKVVKMKQCFSSAIKFITKRRCKII